MKSENRPKVPRLSDIPADQVTPAVLTLLEICRQQAEQIQALRDEIARLKGQKPRPEIKPSKLESGEPGEKKRRKRGRRGKRKKTKKLAIHEVVRVRPEGLPEGSRFKGYQEYTVQDVRIEVHNTRFLLERWETPWGDCRIGQLPTEMREGHFGPTLRAYILQQYYHAHVTQPLLLEELREWGIDISAGQLSAIITEGKEDFHAEKEEVLRVGLETSRYIHVDDTGARHQGRNGYCTHMGNERFAYFASTESKSRMNFLELLRAGHEDYVVCNAALAYMKEQGLPKGPLELLTHHPRQRFCDRAEWNATLERLRITKSRQVRIATEGALLGSALEHGMNPDLGVMSDDAGQFAILRHALCWIHAERVFAKLIGLCDAHREALEGVRREIWEIYAELKAYKNAPNDENRIRIEGRFDRLCHRKTCFVPLNQALERMFRNKGNLLLVLDRPELPLHNNLSERDIREYVKKRKISGSTRSDEGRRCRDTFTSLKKTCRKQGISFWEYLIDRVHGTFRIPRLGEWIRQQVSSASVTPPEVQPSGP